MIKVRVSFFQRTISFYICRRKMVLSPDYVSIHDMAPFGFRGSLLPSHLFKFFPDCLIVVLSSCRACFFRKTHQGLLSWPPWGKVTISMCWFLYRETHHWDDYPTLFGDGKDLSCAMSYGQGITHPVFDEPVGSTG